VAAACSGESHSFPPENHRRTASGLFFRSCFSVGSSSSRSRARNDVAPPSTMMVQYAKRGGMGAWYTEDRVTPSLKLQELLRTVLARTGFASTAKVSGATPAAKGLAVAGLAARDARRDVVLVVVPADRDVDQLTADTRFFLGGLEGGSARDLEAAVLPFPSHEVDPYRGLAPHIRIASARARALQALAAGQARVVIASAQALTPRVVPPDALFDLVLDLRPGGELDIQRLAETLIDGGFTREDPVAEHGVFCIRGGVIDVFPAVDELPARIELVGDTIESIRRFDPITQRSLEATDRLVFDRMSVV
jgi:transcription-repair coupling factor (superfamily II helicase)